MAKKENGDYIRFRCKACGKKLKIRAHYEGGHIIACPRCQCPVTVPIANPDAVIGERLLGESPVSGGKRGAVEPLLTPLDQAQAPDAGAGVGRWRPEVSLGRFRELDKLKGTVERLDDQAVEKIQRMLRHRRLKEGDILPQMRRVAEQRAQAIRESLASYRDEMKSRIRELEARRATLTEDAFKRLDRLKRSLVALDLYVRLVLCLEE